MTQIGLNRPADLRKVGKDSYGSSSPAQSLAFSGIRSGNDAMQAFFIFSAGSYEELWKKHESMTPPEEVALKFKYTTVNKSVRMTNIQG